MKKLLIMLTILGISSMNMAYAKTSSSACSSKVKHCASSCKQKCGKKASCSKKNASTNIPKSTEDLTK